MGYHEGALQNEYDDISMNTKNILTHFVETFGTIRFDERFFQKLYEVIHYIEIENKLM